MITKNRFFRVFSKEAIFLSLYPLLFFPAHGKILAWAGRKNTRVEKGNFKIDFLAIIVVLPVLS